MKCNVCQKEVDSNYNICPYCGNPLKNTHNNNTSQTPKKTNPTTIIICIIIFLCIITISGTIINKTYFTDNTTDEKNNLNNNIIDNNNIDNTENNDITSDETSDTNNNLLNEKWNNYKIVYNSQVLSLPCSYEELSSLTGVKMKLSDEKSYLEKNYYTLVNMYKNDTLALYTEIYNNTDNESTYAESKITRISQSKYQVEKSGIEIIFPGNIKAGMSITKDEIINKFGNPTNINNYNQENYISETYTYNEDTTWTTTNYFKIKVVNGIIDEITLDNRR